MTPCLLQRARMQENVSLKKRTRRDFWRQVCSNYAKNNFPFWQTYSRSHWTLAAREMTTEIERALRYNLAAFLERDERASFPYRVSEIFSRVPR